MTAMLVFNTVHYDGIGDFFHFEDIMNALLNNERFNNVEVLAFICFNVGGSKKNFECIEQKLKNGLCQFERVKVYFGDMQFHQELRQNAALQAEMNTAVKGFIISFDGLGSRPGGSLVKTYADYCESLRKIPFIYIGEHESAGPSCAELSKVVTLQNRSLGLGKEGEEWYYGRTYGLKLKEHIPLKTTEAWDIIQRQAPFFSSELLHYTHSEDIHHCMQHNTLIPVFLHNPSTIKSILMRFLCFLSNNLITENPKNIMIYLSGSRIESEENWDSLQENLEKDKDIYHPNFKMKSIVTIDESNRQHIITLECPGYTIGILSGFYLDDIAYDAFYHLSNVAAVSGDNSLERCISMNILPFYWSSNHTFKWKTERALQKITQDPQLKLTPEVRRSFEIFFASGEREANIVMPFCYYKDFLDVPKMIQEWPIVTAYLRENKNFYNHLEGIILEGLPETVKDDCKRTDTSHLSVQDSNLTNDLDHRFGHYLVPPSPQPVNNIQQDKSLDHEIDARSNNQSASVAVISSAPSHDAASVAPIGETMTEDEKKLHLAVKNGKNELLTAIQEMHHYGEVLKNKGASKGQVMTELSDQLTASANIFYEKNEWADWPEFKKEFLALLNSKNKEMSKYRVKWSTIIKNVALALTGLGLLCIAANLIYSKVIDGRALFFFQKSKTTSEEKIEAVKQSIDKIGPKLN